MRNSAPVLLVALLMLSAACGDDDDAGSDDPGNGRDDAGQAGRDSARAGAGGRSSGGTGPAAAGSSGGSGRGAGGAGAPAAGSGGRSAVDADGGLDADGGGQPIEQPSGSFLALTYNVAGLPEGLSSSMPATNTPLIGPLLNGYDLVLLQETWQTPDPNPFAPLRVYHEILVAASNHPYKTVSDDLPFGNDPSRPSALLGDGLNVFSRFPLEDTTTRVAWETCVETASDCLAFKGFSMTKGELSDGVPVHIYDLHMEAGNTRADDDARDAGLTQLLTFMEANSSGTAVIVGGDFNLDTGEEPAKSQFARLLAEGKLKDACTELLCEDPDSIDKLLFRSSDRVDLSAESWSHELEVFMTMGQPLSDHPPVAVRFRWQARAE